MTRVAVFIDYQNLYHGSRQSFDWGHEPPWVGQTSPLRLGSLLCHMGTRMDASRQLVGVKVHRGLPSPDRSPTGNAACQRQVEEWNRHPLVEAVTRPLSYRPIEWDQAGVAVEWEVREKGIDVLVALAIVMGAMKNEYDVAVLCSRDSDLMPALEATQDLGKRVEVMSWGSARPWRINGRQIWCHNLDPQHYDQVSDEVDYTKPLA